MASPISVPPMSIVSPILVSINSRNLLRNFGAPIPSRERSINSIFPEPLGTVLEVCLRVRPSDAIRVLGALLRMILELWAAPPRCGYLGELRIFFVLLPRIFGCGGSFTRAFLLGRLDDS